MVGGYRIPLIRNPGSGFAFGVPRGLEVKGPRVSMTMFHVACE